MPLHLPTVYAITDRVLSGIDDHAAIAKRLFAAGIRCVQVREKTLPDRALLAAVDEVGNAARESGAIALVDDRVDIAKLAGVGVHLGQDDLPADAARDILGPGPVVGVSTHDTAAARSAFSSSGADYVAFGPVFSSSTKPGRRPRGLEELSRVARSKTRPLVAIGGITEESLDSALDAGADSVAMIGALLAGGEIETNARRVLDRVRRRVRPGRVYLVGFMGAGKTEVGRRVAERLGVPFVDLDAEIERTSGATVRALFESSGEAAFRRREATFLEGTAALSDAVIATGGGCYTFEENRRTIARLGRAVFLDVPFPALASRLAGKTDRPLFERPDQAARLFGERLSFYRMAPIRVALEQASVEEAADRVLEALDRPPAVRPDSL